MWIYKKKEFKESMIPENAIGFIYVMTVIINGVLYKYIGKKNFYSDVKTKLKKNEVSLDKRIKKYKRVRKFTYENYYSSNSELKEAHKNKEISEVKVLIEEVSSKFQNISQKLYEQTNNEETTTEDFSNVEFEEVK